MRQLTLTIPVRDARLEPSPAQKLTIAGYLRTREGKAVNVTLSKPTQTRSGNQNRFYWGVVVDTIARETGHTVEEVHAVLKQLFLPRRFVTVGKREHELPKTTTELSTDEFTLFLEAVRAWASTDLGLTLPLANGDLP